MADPVTYWESYQAEHRTRLPHLCPWQIVDTVVEVGSCCSPNARYLLELYPHLKFSLVDRDQPAMDYGVARLVGQDGRSPVLGTYKRDVTVPNWWDWIPRHDVILSCWCLSELPVEDVPTAWEGYQHLGTWVVMIEPDRARKAILNGVR